MASLQVDVMPLLPINPDSYMASLHVDVMPLVPVDLDSYMTSKAC
jgi:hypothetical protein